MAKLLTWTAREAAIWGRLLTCARECAADPSRPAGDLRNAVDKAEKAVIPTRDEEGRAKVFRLWKFARTWAALDEEGRAVNAQALGQHAEAAAGYIDPVTGKVVSLADHKAKATTRARPFRADIDG